MTDVILGLVVLLVAVGVAFVVHLAREQAISAGATRALAAICAVGLIAMLLTDWPSELLSGFWAQHSILAGILSTVLLIGVVFLVFEEREQRAQERLDNGLTAAGLGGIVDHLVDVEVALALLSGSQNPEALGWDDWDDPTIRPLRWLRTFRERLFAVDGEPGTSDPRRFPASLAAESCGEAWRVTLVDQCVRRLLAGLRDWSPLIGVSKNGIVALLAVSELRKDLMELSSLMEEREASSAEELLVSLRQRARILAHFCEERSGARPHRQEVLQSIDPLPQPPRSLAWEADTDSSDLFDKRWNSELQHSIGKLSR